MNCGSQSEVLSISGFPISGYKYGFPVREIPVLILWIANFQFPLYEICVRNQWGHNFEILVEELDTGGPSLITIRIDNLFA